MTLFNLYVLISIVKAALSANGDLIRASFCSIAAIKDDGSNLVMNALEKLVVTACRMQCVPAQPATYFSPSNTNSPV